MIRRIVNYLRHYSTNVFKENMLSKFLPIKVNQIEPSSDIIWSKWIGQVNDQKLRYEISNTVRQARLHAQSLDLIWTAWNTTLSGDTLTVAPIHSPVIVPTSISPSAVDYQRIEADRRTKEQAAKDKAEILLLEHLSAKQKDDLKKKGYFLVEVAGEVYKIKRGFSGNVKLINKETEQEMKSFCIHPHERVPDGDAMLAQKLLLESNLDQFLKIANCTNLVPQNDNRRAA